jgi:hypothetical protein
MRWFIRMLLMLAAVLAAGCGDANTQPSDCQPPPASIPYQPAGAEPGQSGHLAVQPAASLAHC